MPELRSKPSKSALQESSRMLFYVLGVVHNITDSCCLWCRQYLERSPAYSTAAWDNRLCKRKSYTFAQYRNALIFVSSAAPGCSYTALTDHGPTAAVGPKGPRAFTAPSSY